MSTETMEQILAVGGKTNSLGRAGEILAKVLADRTLLDELYNCMLSDNLWVRMRAADSFEKVCREHPDWIEPYIVGIQKDLSDDGQQPSIKWHIAEVYPQVHLTPAQKQNALDWLAKTLSSHEIDWIVSVNCMKTLTYFSQKGDYPTDELVKLLHVQLGHKSNAVVKKANKLLATVA